MKTIYLLLVFLIIAISTHAVDQKREIDVRKYKTELNLTQDQLKKIDHIQTNFKAKPALKSAGTNANDNQEVARQNIERRIQMRKEISQVLTPNQRKAYYQLRKAERERNIIQLPK